MSELNLIRLFLQGNHSNSLPHFRDELISGNYII